MGFLAKKRPSTVSEPKNASPSKSITTEQPLTITHEVQELKSKLKSLLIENEGSAKHPDVVAAVNELVSHNPSRENSARSSRFHGEFLTLTAPAFHGRIKPKKDQEGVIQYTLGRLSFKIFEPSDLVCTVRGIRNQVIPREVNEEEEDCNEDQKRFEYPLIMDLTIHAPGGDLQAVLSNEANCYENPDVNNRLMVTFTGGTLVPVDEVMKDKEKLKIWDATFAGAYKMAEKKRSRIGKFLNGVVKYSFGLTTPTDESSQHSFHFNIKRSPVGHLDILYLDDDLRITKGNKGSIVVAERLK